MQLRAKDRRTSELAGGTLGAGGAAATLSSTVVNAWVRLAGSTVNLPSVLTTSPCHESSLPAILADTMAGDPDPFPREKPGT